ncbi:hypothetical protein ABZ371_29620, partial [Streptomyces sp. NPDC005899]
MDGSRAATDDAPGSAPSRTVTDPPGSDAAPAPGPDVPAQAADTGTPTTVDTTTNAMSPAADAGADGTLRADDDTTAVPVPTVGTTPAPPEVATVGSFAHTGDERDVSGTPGPEPDTTYAVGPRTIQGRPLTVVVSEGPPPGEGSPEAAELLDGAGTDRAVVLGPPAVPDGSGRRIRAAVELTREGPDAPVRVRPLAGPAPAAPAGGTSGAPVADEAPEARGGADATDAPGTPDAVGVTDDSGSVDASFPGADVLLPLADALGPMPRPVTRSAGTADTAPVVPSTTTHTPAKPDDTAPLVRAQGPAPDPAATPAPAPAEHTAPPRPGGETATDLYLEGGEGGPGRTGGGEPALAPGAARGGGTPPPPPPATPETSPVTPPAALPPPPARIVVRPAPGTAGGGGGGPRRPADEPAVVTLDGRTVPLAQVRRLVPDATDRPAPGRAVRTLTLSQSPAEDGTARDAGRRALLGQDTFRGVRTVSAPAPAPADAEAGSEAPPPVPRTVFTGPPAPLPGADDEQGADWFVTHGTPRTVTLGTDDPALPGVTVSGVQLGEALKAWAVEGDEDRPLVLYSCETGRQPDVAGLPVAQHVANRTGRPVYAPTTEVGTARDRAGDVRAVLTEGPDGPGRWRLFTPEPDGEALDAAARDAGLHVGPGPADVFARARTLQQIRTLRDALGPDAEKRPGNRRLLAGLAYVDGLRWLGESSAARYGDGRMTPDLLRRMVTDRHAATGGPQADPTPEQYTAFLSAAAGLRDAAGPATTLDELLPPPLPRLPPDTPVSREEVRGLAYAPSAEVAWSLSDDPLPLSELGLGPEDTAELTRRRSGATPPSSRPDSPAGSLHTFAEDPVATAGRAPLVRADGLTFHRVDARGDGDCLFRATLDSARSRAVPPAWAARNIAGLRALVRDRVAGSELGGVADTAVPDPVFTVLDDLRIRALAGVHDTDGQRRVTEHWNRVAREVVTDGDPVRWQRILADSDYPQLAEVAPTPADARRLGGRGLLAAAAERPGLWSSPFADLLPEALAHTLDLDLRLVRPDPAATGPLLVTQVHPGGTGGTLHLAYNGRDHYDALVPAPGPGAEPGPDPAAPPVPPALQETRDADPFGEWLRSMGGITGPDDAETPDRGDPVPLETQLERHRPARLLTGEDAHPPGPAPRTVTFDDGSRLPAVLIRPGADPRDTAPDGAPQGSPTGLLTGPGVLTLRSPELAARQILDQLPAAVRTGFDETELLRLLTDQPSAFTAPRGARIVGREKSGVGLEMTVEAIPHHRWERFSDVGGATVRLDTMRRGQAGTGGGRSVGFGRRIAAGLGMGPPLNWLLKIGVSMGWSRRTDYAQGTSAYSQAEHRAHEGSHLHLDDVHYRVRVRRVTEEPAATAPAAGPAGAPGPGPGWRRGPVLTAGLGMRDGLGWRRAGGR